MRKNKEKKPEQIQVIIFTSGTYLSHAAVKLAEKRIPMVSWKSHNHGLFKTSKKEKNYSRSSCKCPKLH